MKEGLNGILGANAGNLMILNPLPRALFLPLFWRKRTFGASCTRGFLFDFYRSNWRNVEPPANYTFILYSTERFTRCLEKHKKRSFRISSRNGRIYPAVAASYLECLELFEEALSHFSIRDWVNKEDDDNGFSSLRVG